jgi:hypothetical protein
MQGISTWITTILAVVVIGVVVDLLLNGNRMHKFVRGIFGIITLFVIAAPVPALIASGFEWDFDFGGSVTMDQEFLDSINRRKLAVLERGAQDLLSREGVSDATVRITATIDGLIVEIARVEVNIVNAIIRPDIANINKHEHVVGVVSRGLNIEAGLVSVIG